MFRLCRPASLAERTQGGVFVHRVTAKISGFGIKQHRRTSCSYRCPYENPKIPLRTISGWGFASVVVSEEGWAAMLEQLIP